MSVFVADEQTMAVDASAITSLAEHVLAEEGYPAGSEVTVVLVDDDVIAGYNQRFLDRPGPTDVLAFPLEGLSPGHPPAPSDVGPPTSLGDVIVAPAYVERQARELDVDFPDELSLMVVHGILHLMGYDHETDEAADVMERRERELLAHFGMERR